MARKANAESGSTSIQIDTSIKKRVLIQIEKLNEAASRNNQTSLGGLIEELLDGWAKRQESKQRKVDIVNSGK